MTLQLGLRGGEAKRVAIDLLAQVGIPDPASRYDEYPHQFQRRHAPARGDRDRAGGLAAELLLADEPTTALDVTVQARVLQLIRELQRSATWASS